MNSFEKLWAQEKDVKRPLVNLAYIFYQAGIQDATLHALDCGWDGTDRRDVSADKGNSGEGSD